MALEWNLTEIRDCETVCFEHTEDGERDGIKKHTEALIWYTMACGVGAGITEANVEEFCARIAFYERLFGPIVSNAEGPLPMDMDTVRAHVGMYTNVSMQPRDEWMAYQFQRFATEQGAKVGRLDTTAVTVKFDSSREYNKWSVFYPDGTLYERYHSEMAAMSAKEDLERDLTEEADAG